MSAESQKPQWRRVVLFTVRTDELSVVAQTYLFAHTINALNSTVGFFAISASSEHHFSIGAYWPKARDSDIGTVNGNWTSSAVEGVFDCADV